MIVEFVDKLDDAFDVAGNDEVDIAEDKFVDNREDTVKGVESSGDNTTTNKPVTSAFFFFANAADLPFLAFFGELLSSPRMSRFLIFKLVNEIVDEEDDAFDAAENVDGDVAEDNFADDWGDTVEGVENNGDCTTTNEPMTFFFLVNAADLLFFVFFAGLLSLFAMIEMNAWFMMLFKRVEVPSKLGF